MTAAAHDKLILKMASGAWHACGDLGWVWRVHQHHGGEHPGWRAAHDSRAALCCALAGRTAPMNSLNCGRISSSSNQHTLCLVTNPTAATLTVITSLDTTEFAMNMRRYVISRTPNDFIVKPSPAFEGKGGSRGALSATAHHGVCAA